MEATATTIRTLDVALAPDEVEHLEAVDCVLHGQADEHVDIGPFAALDGAYLRVRSTDLVHVAEELRLLADRIIDTVMEARQEAVERERHHCSCGALLELDEITCGKPLCERRYAEDVA